MPHPIIMRESQTALEPEADGVPLEGLAFHKFYFDAAAKTEAQIGALFSCVLFARHFLFVLFTVLIDLRVLCCKKCGISINHEHIEISKQCEFLVSVPCPYF